MTITRLLLFLAFLNLAFLFGEAAMNVLGVLVIAFQ
jgi:hypothetical protein